VRSLGDPPPTVQLPERAIAKDRAERTSALFENSLTVRNEQEREVSAFVAAQLPIIQCRYDSLACPSCCDDEVLVPIVTLPFNH